MSDSGADTPESTNRRRSTRASRTPASPAVASPKRATRGRKKITEVISEETSEVTETPTNQTDKPVESVSQDPGEPKQTSSSTEIPPEIVGDSDKIQIKDDLDELSADNAKISPSKGTDSETLKQQDKTPETLSDSFKPIKDDHFEVIEESEIDEVKKETSVIASEISGSDDLVSDTEDVNMKGDSINTNEALQKLQAVETDHTVDDLDLKDGDGQNNWKKSAEVSEVETVKEREEIKVVEHFENAEFEVMAKEVKEVAGKIEETADKFQEKTAEIKEMSKEVEQKVHEVEEKVGEVAEMAEEAKEMEVKAKNNADEVEEKVDEIKEMADEVEELADKTEETADKIGENAAEVKKKAAEVDEKIENEDIQGSKLTETGEMKPVKQTEDSTKQIIDDDEIIELNQPNDNDISGNNKSSEYKIDEESPKDTAEYNNVELVGENFEVLEIEAEKISSNKSQNEPLSKKNEESSENIDEPKVFECFNISDDESSEEEEISQKKNDETGEKENFSKNAESTGSLTHEEKEDADEEDDDDEITCLDDEEVNERKAPEKASNNTFEKSAKNSYEKSTEKSPEIPTETFEEKSPKKSTVNSEKSLENSIKDTSNKGDPAEKNCANVSNDKDDDDADSDIEVLEDEDDLFDSALAKLSSKNEDLREKINKKKGNRCRGTMNADRESRTKKRSNANKSRSSSIEIVLVRSLSR